MNTIYITNTKPCECHNDCTELAQTSESSRLPDMIVEKNVHVIKICLNMAGAGSRPSRHTLAICDIQWLLEADAKHFEVVVQKFQRWVIFGSLNHILGDCQLSY